MKKAHFHFDSDLADLLPRAKRAGALRYEFSGPQSVKHLIESLGIPHTEIGEIICNNTRVDLGYLVQDGDRIEAHVAAAAVSAEGDPCFALDGHLGRLSARLRMLGFDCLYRGDYTDEELAQTAVTEDRFLLTRDRRLLMRKSISRGYLVRHLDASRQLAEVAARFGLEKWIKPFTRCIRCNHPLQSVPKEDVLDRLQPLTRLYYEDFRLCRACGQIYWNGSHVDRMRRIIASLGS
jgi:uncharacterized protein